MIDLLNNTDKHIVLFIHSGSYGLEDYCEVKTVRIDLSDTYV